jgi:hypothetical protein
MDESIAEVRAWLGALTGARPSRKSTPQLLRRLAARQVRCPEQISDALQDLALDTLVRTRKGQPGGAQELLALEDPAKLVACLNKRLRQVLAEKADPRAKLRKSIAAMVRMALKDKNLPAVEAAPLTLVLNNKISSALVREAVAYELGQEGASRCPRHLTKTLLDQHFPLDDQLHDAHGRDLRDGACLEEQVLTAVDGETIAAGLEARVGRELMEAVAMRVTGHGLRAIADHQGLGVSTISERLGRAAQLLRAHAESESLCRASVETALALVAA